jgi:hypothetical protein
MNRFSFKHHLPKPSYDLTMDLILQDINQVPEVAAVYVMVGHNGDYTYTGRTKNLRARLDYHFKRKPDTEMLEDIHFGGVDHILVFECENELDTKVLKQYFIEGDIYQGKYNIQFVHDFDRLDIKQDVEADLYGIPYFFYQFNRQIVELESMKPKKLKGLLSPDDGFSYETSTRKRSISDEEKIKIEEEEARKAKEAEEEKRLETEIKEKQIRAFEELILRILKYKKSSTQLPWSIYEHDYEHLLDYDTKRFLNDILDRRVHNWFGTKKAKTKIEKEVLVLSDKIEAEKINDRIKIRFTGYREYAFEQFDKGNTDITSLEKFWEELQV